MRRILPILIFAVTFCQLLNSQAIVSQGKPVAEIFTDFHWNLDDSTKTTGFGMNRAYLGYNFLPGGSFSGSIIVNIGNPDDLSPESVRRRYAFFREASITYTKNKLNISLGITDTHLFDFQQKFWGKRYVANTYQSINGYGYIADLGVALDYKFNDIWKCDITIMNSEGYAWGISGTGGINIFKKTELFARYDYSASVIVPGENAQWNFLNDGRFSVYGIQYTFSENVKMALDYQGTYPYSTDKHVSDAIYVNARFKF